MKFYMSSNKIGKNPRRLAKLMNEKSIALITNACDGYVDKKRKKKSIDNDLRELKKIGLTPEIIDLKKYFGKKSKLEKKMASFGGVYVRGGNTFILRQAMKLSGFDKILKKMKRQDFVYAGYSAGICVLAPSLKGIQHVDDPNQHPYRLKKTIWKGLGFFDYIILPHYKSNHPESNDMQKEVKYCKKHKIKFMTLRDGEVIIIR